MKEAKLIGMLKEVRVCHGKIDLYERIIQMKNSAESTWLNGLGKNGYEHSERLENYLDTLTKKLRREENISSAEVFVLLCAVYMHDIGYRCEDGTMKSEGHPQRSRKMIKTDLSTYHFEDFPPFKRGCPRVAEAVGFVCCGHSQDISLEEIPVRFYDMVFGTNYLNLRKLTALLRIADEADDPYIRNDPLKESIRDSIPLVEIGDETIIWHRDRAAENDPFEFQKLLEEKIRVLDSSINYLCEIEAGNRYLALDPQVTLSIPFMAEKPVETFVGRQRDLEMLHEKIRQRDEGAVTGIFGTGGTGKTELTKYYAKTYKKEYPGGVFWVSLKGSTWQKEAEKLISAACKTEKFSRTFPDNQSAKDYLLKNIFVRKDALLIIDNVGEGLDIIKPGCTVLVTTRNKDALGSVPWGAVFELHGLSVDEGLRLLSKFLGRQRMNRDCEGASQLVKILGGMPLAIEIAARYLSDVPDLSFPGYIGRIKNKIDELQIEGETDENVRSSLELSLEQLTSMEYGKDLLSLFESAGVCAETGFTSRTLVKTAGFDIFADYKKQDLVAKLHQRSLLEFNADSNRYSMHPLLRQMAEKRLHDDPDRENQFKSNHCRFFLHYCESHDDDPDTLLTEKDGIWQALIQAGQLEDAKDLRRHFLEHLGKPYWNYIKREQYTEAFLYLTGINLINIDDIGEVQSLITLLDTYAKKNLSKLDPISQGWVLNSTGLAYTALGENQKAIDLFEEALKISRNINDTFGEGSALSNKGLAYLQLSKFHEAIDLYKKALEIARQIGDVDGEGNALGNMGLAYADLGEYHKAISMYEAVLEIHRRIGDTHGEGSDLSNIASAHVQLGEYKTAISLYEAVLENRLRIGDAHGEGNAFCNMGLAYAYLGEYQKAIGLYENALGIHRLIGDINGEGNDLCNLGLVYKNIGDCHKAIELYEEALRIHRHIGDARGEASDLGNLGSAYLQLEEYQKAIDLYEDALEIDRRIGYKYGEGSDLCNMGLAYADLGEYQKAIGMYEDALTIHRRIGDVCGEGITLCSMGLVHKKTGNYQKAIGMYEDALTIHRRIGDVHNEGIDLGNIGLAYAALGEYKTAIDLYKNLLDIVRRIDDVYGEGSVLGNMSVAYAALGDKERAYQCLDGSKVIFENLGLDNILLKLDEIEKNIDSKSLRDLSSKQI